MAVQKDELHRAMPIYMRGLPLEDAPAAMILIHGRGAGAGGILPIADEFDSTDPSEARLAYVVPQAMNNTWYPTTFLAPLEANEPYLSSALAFIGDAVQRINEAGIPTEKIVLLGFSQGACLSLEYAARNAQRFGGVVALSGGLIGPEGTPRDYESSLDSTPVFLGCSDIDPHIPLERVKESTEVVKRMGADVTERIYQNMGHTVNMDEIEHVKGLLNNLLNS